MDRRSFLKYTIAGVFTLASGKTEASLESKLHESLPNELKELIPKNLDLRAVEDVEEKENGKISSIGRFLRTYRWDNIFKHHEKTCNTEHGLLAGLVMHESYGDPLRLGPGSDVGLWMFIPRTAINCGLKVSSDARELLKNVGRDYAQLARQDERFDILKSSYAATRLIARLYGKFGNSSSPWDSVLASYNQGEPGQNPSSNKYVKSVRLQQEFYLQQLKLIEQIGTINADSIRTLIEANKNNFTISNGKCSYVVIEGDSPGAIASRFNRKYTGMYGRIEWEDIKYSGKTVIPDKIKPLQRLSWELK